MKRTGSEDVIVHVLVPCGPQLLKDVKVNIEFGNLVVGSPVRGGIREDSCKVRPAKGASSSVTCCFVETFVYLGGGGLNIHRDCCQLPFRIRVQKSGAVLWEKECLGDTPFLLDGILSLDRGCVQLATHLFAVQRNKACLLTSLVGLTSRVATSTEPLGNNGTFPCQVWRHFRGGYLPGEHG